MDAEKLKTLFISTFAFASESLLSLFESHLLIGLNIVIAIITIYKLVKPKKTK